MSQLLKSTEITDSFLFAAVPGIATNVLYAAVKLLGFSLGGIIQGSAAAWFQSLFLKGTIGKGTLFSILQKIGAIGILSLHAIFIVFTGITISCYLYKKLQ